MSKESKLLPNEQMEMQAQMAITRQLLAPPSSTKISGFWSSPMEVLAFGSYLDI